MPDSLGTLVNPNGPSGESLMEQIVKKAPMTPANVESAQNPNSILNRVHPDAVRHPLSGKFTRQPSTRSTPKASY